MDSKQAALTTFLVLGGLAVLISSCSEDEEVHHAADTHKATATHGEAHAPAAAHGEVVHGEAAHGEEDEAHEEKEAHEVHWGYAGEAGPAAWGSLSEEFVLCDTGASQSPIDFTAVTIGDVPELKFNYQDSSLEVVNNGHTIQMNFESGSSISLDGKQYELKQLHFHSPSEHTVGGKAYDMVAHMVHSAEDGQLAVIGVMYKAGDTVNSTLNKIWLNMPARAGGVNRVLGVKLNASDLLPRDLTYFSYSGSLTTPPCSEGVNWMVMATPQNISTERVEEFNEMFPMNVRPVQPLNDRDVRVSN